MKYIFLPMLFLTAFQAIYAQGNKEVISDPPSTIPKISDKDDNISVSNRKVHSEEDNMLSGYNPEAEGLVIEKIGITKPKRSTTKFIRSLIHVKVGDVYSQKLHKSIYKYLWTSGLFYSISIDPIVENEKVNLVINVEDKWTLFPVPLLQFGGSNVSGGLLLTDVNFLGTGKVLLASGTYGTQSYSAQMVFVDRGVLGSKFLITAISSINGFNRTDYSHGQASILYNTENKNINQVVRKYQGVLLKTSIGVGYQFEHNLTLYLNTRYVEYWNDITDGLNPSFTPVNPLASSRHIPMALSLDYSGLTPYSIMHQGFEFKSEYTISAYSNEKMLFQGLRNTGSYSIGAGKKKINLFRFFHESLIADYPLILSEHIGGGNTTKSLTKRSVATNKYLGLAAEHLLIVWKNSTLGIITSYGVDFAVYELTGYDKISQPVLNSGAFITMGVILNQVAIPVVQVILGYNFLNQYPTLGISIGI